MAMAAPRGFASPAAFRRWLAGNGTTAKELYVRCAKAHRVGGGERSGQVQRSGPQLPIRRPDVASALEADCTGPSTCWEGPRAAIDRVHALRRG